MTLPPGRNSIPVPGIDPAKDPDLAKAAGELNAWIDYLLHPESHDGPRIYRQLGFNDTVDHDTEMPHPTPSLDEDPAYQMVSNLDGYMADPGVFFRPAQSVAGFDASTIQATYDKLVKGYLTWINPNDKFSGGAAGAIADLKYPEISPTRLNWMTMRSGWSGKQNVSAYEFEGDFLRYQVYTENCIYVVAEHIARYHMIFKTAKDDITKLTDKLTEKFSTWAPKPNLPRVDWPSVLITGLVVVAVAVITEGAGATLGVTLAETVLEMGGEAAKTAATEPGLDAHYHYRDTAKQYLDQVNQIEHDLQVSIEGLYENMRHELDELRQRRSYEPIPQSNTQSTFVPHFKDYVT